MTEISLTHRGMIIGVPSFNKKQILQTDENKTFNITRFATNYKLQ